MKPAHPESGRESAPPSPPDVAASPHVPEKAKENLDVLRQFEDSAEEDASSTQLVIEHASRFFGSPAYFIFVVVFAAAWIAVDSWGRHAGWPHMEPPPFFWLQGLVSFNALLLTVAVLIRQRRMSEMADHRAHLDLQINLLTEQKVTKIIQLLSAGSGATAAAAAAADDHGSSSVADLRKPVDPKALLDEIKRSAAKD